MKQMLIFEVDSESLEFRKLIQDSKVYVVTNSKYRGIRNRQKVIDDGFRLVSAVNSSFRIIEYYEKENDNPTTRVNQGLTVKNKANHIWTAKELAKVISQSN